MSIMLNGVECTDLVLNGVACDSGHVNTEEVFASGPEIVGVSTSLAGGVVALPAGIQAGDTLIVSASANGGNLTSDVTSISNMTFAVKSGLTKVYVATYVPGTVYLIDSASYNSSYIAIAVRDLPLSYYAADGTNGTSNNGVVTTLAVYGHEDPQGMCFTFASARNYSNQAVSIYPSALGYTEQASVVPKWHNYNYNKDVAISSKVWLKAGVVAYENASFNYYGIGGNGYASAAILVFSNN